MVMLAFHTPTLWDVGVWNANTYKRHKRYKVYIASNTGYGQVFLNVANTMRVQWHLTGVLDLHCPDNG